MESWADVALDCIALAMAFGTPTPPGKCDAKLLHEPPGTGAGQDDVRGSIKREIWNHVNPVGSKDSARVPVPSLWQAIDEFPEDCLHDFRTDVSGTQNMLSFPIKYETRTVMKPSSYIQASNDKSDKWLGALTNNLINR